MEWGPAFDTAARAARFNHPGARFSCHSRRGGSGMSSATGSASSPAPGSASAVKTASTSLGHALVDGSGHSEACCVRLRSLGDAVTE
jgi:hypothetical protein